MGEAVEECCCHLGVTEYTGPFTEAEIGRDDDAGLLVEPREQVEQERPARGAEGQVAKFVEDDEVKLGQPVSQLPCLVHGLFLLEGIDQVDGGEEPDLLAVVLDRLDAERGGNVGLARARSADEHNIVGACNDPVEFCSGVMLRRETREYDDGRGR